MKKIVICLLILALAACSNKKAPPDEEGEALNETEEALYVWEYDDDIWPEDEAELYARVYENPLTYSYYQVWASSTLPGYSSSYLTDHSWNSWAEGAPCNGVGEHFYFYWPEYSDKRYRIIAGFALKNGHGDLNHYTKYNRVKSFKIYADDKYIETIPIKDSISFEQYIFKEPMTVYDLRFVIDDVYTGTEFDNTCVAEITLLSKPVNTAQFKEEIMFWLRENGGYYQNNNKEIASVLDGDIDRLLLLDYLPFDIPYDNYNWAMILTPGETKIALLDNEPSLKLKSNLPFLDGATAMYPLYSSFVRAVYPKINLGEIELEEFNKYVKGNDDSNYYDFLQREYLYHAYMIDFNEDHYPFKYIVQCNTTSRAFERLINEEVHIIFCYEPSTADKNAAEEKGIRFNLTPIAYDAFVFIVNEKNKLNNITQQQIRDIYSGRVTNWKYISGVDEPIVAYQRRENSGSQTTLQSIMQGIPLIKPIFDGEWVAGGMGGMIQRVSSDYYNYDIAIGYTFLFYLTKMIGSSGTKVLSVDGVAPTSQTIQDKTYPFTQTVYAITTGNESVSTKKFIEWILSAQGQELVAKTGYTPVK
jgi:phosphate transport system substrate-binding protein